MTALELYDAALIEVNKLEAPSLLLEDYNYFINKAIQQYVNKVYNRYDINQQSTDDLRVLKGTAVLPLIKDISTITTLDMLKSVYVTTLPSDYLHILNCIVEYDGLAGSSKCNTSGGQKITYSARKLTSDMYPVLLTNAYMRPMYKRPYFFINNVTETTNDVKNSTNRDYSTPAYDRNANASAVRLEIRYGKDDKYIAKNVYIDYIKAPMYVKLTESMIHATTDTSQVLEFPDYVCYEVVNEFVKLVMENASDPRIQTNPIVNNTIAPGISQQ